METIEAPTSQEDYGIDGDDGGADGGTRQDGGHDPDEGTENGERRRSHRHSAEGVKELHGREGGKDDKGGDEKQPHQVHRQYDDDRD